MLPFALQVFAGRPKRDRRPRGRKGGKPAVVVKRRGPARLEAAAWFVLACAIMAWPRQGQGSSGALAGELWWRRLLGELTGTPPEQEVRSIAKKEPERGREAHKPSEIPLSGWRDILSRTWSEFNKDRITAVAGGVAFFSLLAVFPALAAFVSLYGLFSDVSAAREQLNMLRGLLPPDALTFVGDQMLRIAGGEQTKLSLAFVVSLLLSLWSANAGVKALLDGLNIAYEEREKRGLIKLNLVSLAFTVGFLIFAIVVLGAVVVVPVVLSVLGFSGEDPMAVLRWPLLFAAIVLVLQMLYRYGPSRALARWRWVSWGSVTAAVLWLVASLLFSLYVSNFAHYDRTYGSLGAVVGFMTWLWLSTIVVLFGAELNAEIEHQTAVDSTTGAPARLGSRGAKMADTVGETAQKAKAKSPADPEMADPRAKRAGAGRMTRRDKPVL